MSVRSALIHYSCHIYCWCVWGVYRHKGFNYYYKLIIDNIRIWSVGNTFIDICQIYTNSTLIAVNDVDCDAFTEIFDASRAVYDL